MLRFVSYFYIRPAGVIISVHLIRRFTDTVNTLVSVFLTLSDYLIDTLAFKQYLQAYIKVMYRLSVQFGEHPHLLEI